MTDPTQAQNAGANRLVLEDVHAWYGESHALQGVNLEIVEGEIVTLLGRNGAGKTTTLKSIIGLMDRTGGSISLRGRELLGRKPEEIARAGIAYCPEERGIFSSLSVLENLLLPPVIGPGGLGLDRIYDLFPNLLERRSSPGTKLSGGEQQMLAIARILRTGAHLLLLDEPTEGLAPVIIQEIGALIRSLKEEGFTILLVEQNFRFAATVSDRYYVMERGKVIDELGKETIGAHADRLVEYLGV
ncbi:ABC transporter ATP-binding protein [Actibacterium sp. D379-3]